MPVVKINVPKTQPQQQEKDSIYRQLKGASDELTFVKRKLEEEKQKAEQIQNYMAKNL